MVLRVARVVVSIACILLRLSVHPRRKLLAIALVDDLALALLLLSITSSGSGLSLGLLLLLLLLAMLLHHDLLLRLLLLLSRDSDLLVDRLVDGVRGDVQSLVDN